MSDVNDFIPIVLKIRFESFVKLALGNAENFQTLDHYVFSEVKESGAETGAILQSTRHIKYNNYTLEGNLKWECGYTTDTIFKINTFVVITLSQNIIDNTSIYNLAKSTINDIYSVLILNMPSDLQNMTIGPRDINDQSIISMKYYDIIYQMLNAVPGGRSTDDIVMILRLDEKYGKIGERFINEYNEANCSKTPSKKSPYFSLHEKWNHNSGQYQACPANNTDNLTWIECQAAADSNPNWNWTNVTRNRRLLRKCFVSPDGKVKFNEQTGDLHPNYHKYQNFYRICKPSR
tara:strand:+ start:126 stop:998 length:873 start_codon:yes stop_codon:yes gene_type:complete